jgi:hypothetical protein
MRAIAKFEKRGRYEYSGFLEQEKYNYKPNNLILSHIFVRNSKSSWLPPALMSLFMACA